MKTLLSPFFLLMLGCCHAQQSDSVRKDTLSPELTFHLDEQKLTIGLELGLSYSHRKVNSPEHQELVDCRKQHETIGAGGRFSGTVRYELPGRRELVTGITFFQTGFLFQEEVSLSDTLDKEFLVGCEVYPVVDPQYGYVYAGFHDPRYGYMIDGLHPSSGIMSVQLIYNYVEVPLLLKQNFGRKYLQGYVMAGGGANYMVGLKHTTTVTGDNGYISTYTTREVSDICQRWNFSAIAKAGVEKKYKEKISVGVYVGATYLLRSIFSNDYYSAYRENHFAFFFGTGFQYHLGKSKG